MILVQVVARFTLDHFLLKEGPFAVLFQKHIVGSFHDLCCINASPILVCFLSCLAFLIKFGEKVTFASVWQDISPEQKMLILQCLLSLLNLFLIVPSLITVLILRYRPSLLLLLSICLLDCILCVLSTAFGILVGSWLSGPLTNCLSDLTQPNGISQCRVSLAFTASDWEL